VAFAHDAVLAMEAEGDARAPGAAITASLCGQWEHEPPCPLAPHHTRASGEPDHLSVRTLFAVEPDREPEVREKIGCALAAGLLVGPDGRDTRWRLVESRPSAVRPEEAAHARRLARS
jgi:hypothetical protein